MRALQATMLWRILVNDTAAENIIAAYSSAGTAVENVYPGLCPAFGTQDSFFRLPCQFDPPIRVKVCHMIKLVFLILVLRKLDQSALQRFVHLSFPAR